jgi:hypothetical protein
LRRAANGVWPARIVSSVSAPRRAIPTVLPRLRSPAVGATGRW